MIKKTCSKCGELLDATTENFGKCSRNKSGLRSVCKTCRMAEGKKYYEENKEWVNLKNKVYRDNHKEERALIAKIYNENNKRYKDRSSA